MKRFLPIHRVSILGWMLIFMALGACAFAQSPGEGAPGENPIIAVDPVEGSEPSVVALLIGIGDTPGSPFSRLTADDDIDLVESALRTLVEREGKSFRVIRQTGEEATSETVRNAITTTMAQVGPKDTLIVYYVGSIFASVDTGSGPGWILSTSESVRVDESLVPGGGVSLDWVREAFSGFHGSLGMYFFDVLASSSSGADARTVASALLNSIGNEKIPVLLLTARENRFLESATRAQSFLSRSLDEALENLGADDFPNGDSDGRMTVSEMGKFLSARIETFWTAKPESVDAALTIQGYEGNETIVSLSAARLATLQTWKDELERFVEEKKLDARYAIEARRVLDGEHAIDTVPENRRGDFIALLGRFVREDLPPEDYQLQRSIILGTSMEPSIGTDAGTVPSGFWGHIPRPAKIGLFAVLGGLIVYLVARIFLARSQEPEDFRIDESVPFFASDTASPAKAGKGQRSRAMDADSKALESFQSGIRPVGQTLTPPKGSAGVGSLSSSPTPRKGVSPVGAGVPRSAAEIRAALEDFGKTEDLDEGFDQIDRPPTIADLRARTNQTPPPNEEKATAETTPSAVGDVDLDLDAVSQKPISDKFEIKEKPPKVPGSPVAESAKAAAVSDLKDVDLDLDAVLKPETEPGVSPIAPPPRIEPRAVPSPEVPPPAAPEPPPKAAIVGKPIAAGSHRIEGMPSALVTPGVLPAVIRAWNVEWTGPLARSRFRILLGSHLEMGRPAMTRDSQAGDLVISLLPVGENKKPNAALIAMLSRRAFTFDLVPEGIKLTVTNKASAHLSPDPHRPYWDWENPMPGTERVLPPGETLWISPHFGKEVAPILVRSLPTGDSAAGPCGAEMRFDAVFQDLVGIGFLIVPDGFELIWGAEGAAQVLPNVGEGPENCLVMRFTPDGLAVTVRENGVWTRRQGKMIDEQTLLLGGVSSVEWKSERGEMTLKMTPHALPRLGTIGSGPAPGSK